MHRMYRTLRTAFRALRRNKMRSVLTTLGIIIGVAAVIAMTEIGQGSSALVQKTIQSMGANNLLVMPGTASSGGVSFGSGSVITLTPQDAEALSRECPAVTRRGHRGSHAHPSDLRQQELGAALYLRHHALVP
jgi:ABC-type lipoprotein release transport system permease subunit